MSDKTRECPACGGKGRRYRRDVPTWEAGEIIEERQIDDGPCEACEGQGRVKDCSWCRGEGVEEWFDVKRECEDCDGRGYVPAKVKP